MTSFEQQKLHGEKGLSAESQGDQSKRGLFGILVMGIARLSGIVDSEKGSLSSRESKRSGKKKKMTEIELAMLLVRLILINTKNLIKAVDQAKTDDGRITADELPAILMDTAIKSLDDLGINNLGGLIR